MRNTEERKNRAYNGPNGRMSVFCENKDTTVHVNVKHTSLVPEACIANIGTVRASFYEPNPTAKLIGFQI